jgi:hypothetical protein
MELTHEDNVATAAAPQAINTAVTKKQPVYDNDPTRDISTRQSAESLLVFGLATAALLAMFVVTVLVFLGR